MDNTTQKTDANQLPPALNGLVPYLQVDGAAKAAEFYKHALAQRKPIGNRSTTRAGRCTSISTSTAAR